MSQALRKGAAGQLLRIIKLFYSFIRKFSGRLLRSLASIAAHHGNPNHQKAEIGMRKAFEDSILHRPGALGDSLGSSRRKQRNEAVNIGVLVECFNQRWKRIIQSGKHRKLLPVQLFIELSSGRKDSNSFFLGPVQSKFDAQILHILCSVRLIRSRNPWHFLKGLQHI